MPPTKTRATAGLTVPLAALEKLTGLTAARARQLYARLTPRQRELAGLMARGLTNDQIARELGISPKTGDIHRTDVFDRLETKTSAGVAAVVFLTELAAGAGAEAR